MAIRLNNSIINARLNAIRSAVDAGGGAARIVIYTGSIPAVAGGSTTAQPLATLNMPYPSFNAPDNGSITAFDIPSVVAIGAGTAGWFRVLTATGDFVMDGTVGQVNADMIMPTTSFVAGITVAVSSMVLTDGN